MIKIIIKAILQIILVVIVFVLNLYLAYLLPFPLGNINLIIIFLMLMLGLFGSGNIVWLAFLFGILMDLFSDLPFGIFAISLTISFLLVYWLYYEFFANKSVWALSAVTFTEVVLFRILYTILIIFNATKIKLALFVHYGWEILLTTIAIFILYFILEKIFTRFKLIK